MPVCAVSAFGIPFGVKPPYWPGPWEPPDVIVSYFHTHPTNVLICVFLQIGAQIPLGIFAASVVSRLRFLGIEAAGPNIALFGGFLAVFNSMASGFTTWAHDSSGGDPGPDDYSGSELSFVCLWRPWFFNADGSANRWGVRPGRFP
jgi:hypothetical protein